MDPKRPWECADMPQVRAEIDRIDDTMVDLIAQRFGYVERAWQLKTNPSRGARAVADPAGHRQGEGAGHAKRACRRRWSRWSARNGAT